MTHPNKLSEERIAWLSRHGWGGAVTPEELQSICSELLASRSAQHAERVTWPHVDAEAVERSLQGQREHLINLPVNWDGYGASRIAPSIVDIMLGDIETEGCLAQIVPGASGDLQAEWHLPGVTVEYQISVDGKRHLYVALQPHTTEPMEEAGEDVANSGK